MLGDIPASLDALGTEDAVNGITSLSLYEMLQYILSKCYAEAVFAGNFTEKAEKTVLNMLTGLLGDRKESELVRVSEIIKHEFNGETKKVTEEIDAKQGRMVLGFSMPDTGDSTASVEVFNEIFGGSPVSRLFMNVRERLQLCYYCASVQNTHLNTMYVRSGINEDKRDIATKEILNQLENLKNSENVSEYEISAAKKSLLSIYKEIDDSIVRYAFWYIGMRVSGKKTDISECVRDIEAVDAGAVSDVAKRVRFVISYFLRGKEE
jgi:predicted Zn-dependent peptidase